MSLVLIRDQRRRWGSCDPKGNLRFNWRIVQAPMRLLDYVVAHELVHLANRNHTAAFWAALGRVMPDYAERREETARDRDQVGMVMLTDYDEEGLACLFPQP